MSQHTPGPWTVSEQETGRIYIASDDNLALAGMFFTAHPESAREDARLMAAAPDLLAALEGLTAIVAEYRERVIKGEITGRLLEHDYAELAAARAAIRKATEDSTHA